MSRRRRNRRSTIWALAVTAAIALAACTGDDSSGDESNSGTSTDPTVASGGSTGSLVELPVRPGPRRETTGTVPHVQIDAEPVPALDAELRRRAFELPGVENRPSERSLPGARGLWLAEDLTLERPDVILGSREFAHIHPDGSLHIWLPVERAIDVDEKGWGEIHPWVGREGFWDGVAMVFTPETPDDVDVTMRLVVDAYNFITRADLDPNEVD